MRTFPAHIFKLSLVLVCIGGVIGCSEESSQILLSKAKSSLNAGDKKAAVIQLKSAIQKDENNAEARFELARIQMARGDFASAEKELRRARKAGMKDEQVNPILAQTLLRLNEFQRVLDEIPLPPPGNPAELSIRATHANAHMGLGQIEDARKILEPAAQANSKHAEIQLSLARLSVLEKKVDDALKHLELAISNDPNNLDAWLFKGDLFRAQSNQREAIAAYQHALTIDPDHSGARIVLADIAIQENRLADAKKEIQTVLKTNPNNLLARYTQAVIDYREKKYTQARDQLAEVVKAAPTYLPALFLNGAVEYALGNIQTAEAYLSKVVKAAPNHIPAIRLLAASQLRLGRANDASSTLAPALKKAPQDVGIRIVAGEIALAKKDFAGAAEHFEAASKISPDSAPIRTQLGLSRMGQGDNSRAMSDLQAAAGMGDSNGRAEALLILNQLKNKQFDTALTTIAELEKKQNVNPLVWNYRGAAYLGKKEIATARSSFEQALKIDPTFFPAAANLAQLDLQDKHPELARKRFESILKAKPSHLSAMLALADLALRNQDEKTYLHWLEKAASSNPNAFQPRLLISRYSLNKGQHAKALALAREVINAEPKNPAALDLLGTVQFANKDYDNALSSFRKLADMYPDQVEPRLKLAQVQQAMKHTDDARKTLQGLLSRQPNLLHAQLMLGGIEIQQGNYDAGYKIARKVQQQYPKHPMGFILEGDAAFARKDFPTAFAAFEHAYKLQPSGALLVRQLQILTASQRAEEGEKRLAEWLAGHPQDTVIRATLAESLIQRGQYKGAAEHYLILNKNNPHNLLILNNLAWTLSELNDKRALIFAEQALKLQPDNPAVLDTYGWVLVRLGNVSKGLGILKKAQAKAPDVADIHWHLAYALNKNGDKARARQELKILLDRNMSFAADREARELYNHLTLTR